MLSIWFPQPLKHLSLSELKSSHWTMPVSVISPDYLELPFGVPPRQAVPGYCTRGVLRGTYQPLLCRQVSQTFLCQDTALTPHPICWTWGPIPTAELEAKCDETVPQQLSTLFLRHSIWFPEQRPECFVSEVSRKSLSPPLAPSRSPCGAGKVSSELEAKLR